MGVFDRLARGIKAVGESVKAESGREFMLDSKYGYVHSCPTNLGTGMRASVHVYLPGYTKAGLGKLKARCEELHLQPRGTRGESGGQTGITYDISNKHRLGYSEVQLVQKMIDGVNTLWKEDQEFQKIQYVRLLFQWLSPQCWIKWGILVICYLNLTYNMLFILNMRQ